jgi:DNA-binding CsgD family transcriptional regulator
MLPCALQALWIAMDDDAKVGVKLMDRDGRLIAINECAARLLRQSSEAVCGQRLVDVYPKVHQPRLEQEIGTIVREGRLVCGEGPVCHSTYLLWGYRRQNSTRMLRVEDAAALPPPMSAYADGRKPGEILGILRVCKVADDCIEPAKVVEEVQNSSDRDALLGKLSVLSDRELEVAMLIAAGMSDAEIAQQLFRSLRTVHAHRRSIGSKMRDALGLTSRSQLAREFGERGLRATSPREN